MKEPDYKKLFRWDRFGSIVLVVISWLFTIAGFITHQWWSAIFFGLCGLVLTRTAFWPGKALFPWQKEKDIEREFADIKADDGNIKYTDDGFELPTDKKTLYVKWDKIRAVFAYKVDLYTVDDIRIDVFIANDLSFTMSEETPGYFIFIEKMEEQLPTIDKGWFYEIVAPAFETKLTLLYEMNGRSLEEASTIYYAKK